MTSSHHPQLRLLLAEEDVTTRAFLAENLTADGYAVDVAGDRNETLSRLRVIAPDLIVVDVNGKTLGLIDTLRNGDDSLLAATADTPVIVLTSQPEELHRVRLLERGGDDVILKPFSYPELRARITAVLRRTAPRQPHPVLSAGSLRIDVRTRAVTVAGRAVELSALEYQLLCVLAAEPTRVFTRQELMATIWGCTSLRGRTLDSHASRLRRKLATDTDKLIINVWGVGYRLIDRGIASDASPVSAGQAARDGS